MTEIIVILQEKRSRVIEDVTNWVPVTAISRPGHMIHLVDRFSPRTPNMEKVSAKLDE